MAKNDIFYIIPDKVMRSELRPNFKMVYGVILGLSRMKGYCYATNESIGAIVGIRSGSVSKAIKDMMEMGFLVRIFASKNFIMDEKASFAEVANSTRMIFPVLSGFVPKPEHFSNITCQSAIDSFDFSKYPSLVSDANLYKELSRMEMPFADSSNEPCANVEHNNINNNNINREDTDAGNQVIEEEAPASEPERISYDLGETAIHSVPEVKTEPEYTEPVPTMQEKYALADQIRQRKELDDQNIQRMYGTFQNIRLTALQYESLLRTFSNSRTELDDLIDEMSCAIESGRVKPYKNYYAAMLNWIRDRRNKSKAKQTKQTKSAPNTQNTEEFAPWL